MFKVHAVKMGCRVQGNRYPYNMRQLRTGPKGVS